MHAHAHSEGDEPEISIGELRDLVASTDDVTNQKLVGERFGKYLIVGEVAVGGMAEVFLGVHRGLEGFVKVVVLKRVLPHWSGNEDFVRMFVDEARLAARLDHPNIVRTYEFGEVGGQYFTTMEYLPGEDLAKTLNRLNTVRQRLPVPIAAWIVAQVCAGLHFAHQLTDTSGRPLSLVHRDVNPANVIVTYAGEVKLIDFGVAKTNGNVQTVAGTIKGKLAYMAPEQLLARGVDQRSDVFSAGVVLWELLAQRPLFARDSDAATLYAIMNDPIPLPSRYRQDVPHELEVIVMRALSRTPADRFETAEDMENALEEFLAGQTTKCDARTLGRVLERLFGTARAQAKRAIAQTRSLRSNISLVMRLRTDVRSDLADSLDSIADARPTPSVESTARDRRLIAALALVILLAILGGVLYLVRARSDAAPTRTEPIVEASLELATTPPGAAITIGGEPTGLKTPARLTGLTARSLAVRLDLAGYAPVAIQIEIPEGATLQRQFDLRPEKRP